VDISTAITPAISAQQFIIWTLLGCLLSWMIIFALLAVQPDAKSNAEFDDATLVATAQPVATAPTQLQMLTTRSGTHREAVAGSISSETSIILEKSQ